MATLVEETSKTSSVAYLSKKRREREEESESETKRGKKRQRKRKKANSLASSYLF